MAAETFPARRRARINGSSSADVALVLGGKVIDWEDVDAIHITYEGRFSAFARRNHLLSEPFFGFVQRERVT